MSAFRNMLALRVILWGFVMSCLCLGEERPYLAGCLLPALSKTRATASTTLGEEAERRINALKELMGMTDESNKLPVLLGYERLRSEFDNGTLPSLETFTKDRAPLYWGSCYSVEDKEKPIPSLLHIYATGVSPSETIVLVPALHRNLSGIDPKGRFIAVRRYAQELREKNAENIQFSTPLGLQVPQNIPMAYLLQNAFINSLFFTSNGTGEDSFLPTHNYFRARFNDKGVLILENLCSKTNGCTLDNKGLVTSKNQDQEDFEVDEGVIPYSRPLFYCEYPTEVPLPTPVQK